jgi:hypothetical protein
LPSEASGAVLPFRCPLELIDILDRIIEKYEVVEIERKGHVLTISPQKTVSTWDRLETHDIVNGDPEELVSIDWSQWWSAGEEA